MQLLKSQINELNVAYENYLDVLEQFAAVQAPLDEGNDWVDDLMLCVEDAEAALDEQDAQEAEAAMGDFVDIYEELGEWEMPEALRQVEQSIALLTEQGLVHAANMLRSFLGSYQYAVNALLDQIDSLSDVVDSNSDDL